MLARLHFWTLKDEVFIPDTDIGCFRTYDKVPLESTKEHSYLTEKQEFAEAQNITWIPRNKRPEKLRETLKELEELLAKSRCIELKWVNASIIKLFLSNGYMATLTLDLPNIEKILLDKYLVGKLASEHIVQVVLEPNFLLVSYVEPKLTMVHFGKPFLSRPTDKLNSLDPRVATVNLAGPAGRKLDRFLSINPSRNWALVWWPRGSQEAWPWMPFANDLDRANFLVYEISRSGLSQILFTHIEGDFVKAGFMVHNDNQAYTLVENLVNGELVVTLAFHHIDGQTFEQVSHTTILLKDHIQAAEWSPSESHLVLLCQEHSLVIYDRRSSSTQITQVHLEAVHILWHPSSFLFVLLSAKGQLACYDIGLTCVKVGLLSETEPTPLAKHLDFSQYFRHQPTVRRVAWQPGTAVHLTKILCIVFEQGPVAFLNMINSFHTPLQLVHYYLSAKLIDEAICLLLALNWNVEADICFPMLNLIMQHLFRHILTLEIEAQLEAALGSFYSPSYELEEGVVQAYRTPVRHLARRFFQILLRYFRLEKAFLLAIDLKALDLFMDIYHTAKSQNEEQLALAAQQYIDELESEEGSTCFTSTSESEEFGPEDFPSMQHPCCSSAYNPPHHLDPNEEYVDGDDIPYAESPDKEEEEEDTDTREDDLETKDLQIKFVHFGVV